MSKWKHLLGKKWAFPAIYMVTAALILAVIWWYQDPNEYPITKEELGLEEVNPAENSISYSDEMLAEKLGQTISVNMVSEQMMWPVADINEIEISMEYFDQYATAEELQYAIVSFQDELWPHTGIDIVTHSGEPFDVVAALSGEVIRAEKDPVVGYVVELAHQDGLVTSYSSLSDLQVAKGDKINQGTIIGKASRNIFEKDQGNHLHFEVRKDGVSLNPNLFFGRDLDQALNQLSTEN